LEADFQNLSNGPGLSRFMARK